jgi:hypothetical protein
MSEKSEKSEEKRKERKKGITKKAKIAIFGTG